MMHAFPHLPFHLLRGGSPVPYVVKEKAGALHPQIFRPELSFQASTFAALASLSLVSVTLHRACICHPSLKLWYYDILLHERRLVYSLVRYCFTQKRNLFASLIWNCFDIRFVPLTAGQNFLAMELFTYSLLFSNSSFFHPHSRPLNP